jgi:predicted secreted hydrolase
MTRRHFLASAAVYKFALPDYRYDFPRDHFDHPEFRTEWWYYTGNVRAGSRPFGYELTFFRQAISRGGEKDSPWAVDDVYLAHLALSDIEANRFHHEARLNRSGPGIAGVSARERRVWNGNWQIEWLPDRQALTAVAPEFRLALDLRSRKPPVIHGDRGVSQKMPGEGNGSHYISLTRLETNGEIVVGGKTHSVAGLSWMDHEFFSHEIGGELRGWDWFSLQFDDGTELMLYRLRLQDGSSSEYSSGTFVDRGGRPTHLRRADFEMTPGRRWRSPATGAEYPLDWTLRVPKLGLQLETRAAMDHQELVSTNRYSPSYWEGAIRISGSRTGAGYLEMTGYDKGVRINQ